MKQTTSAGRLLEAKARQAAKIAEVRTALIVTGYRTIAEQAFALGINRSTAWALLNHADKAGPSAIVLKRILSSRNLPQEVRLKVEEYIFEKIAGLYGHTDVRRRWFCDQIENFRRATQQTNNPSRRHDGSKSIDVRLVP